MTDLAGRGNRDPVAGRLCFKYFPCLILICALSSLTMWYIHSKGMHSFFTGLEHVLQVPKVHPMVNESRCHAALVASPEMVA